MRNSHDVQFEFPETRRSVPDLGVLLTDLAHRHHVPGAQLAVSVGGDTTFACTGVEWHGHAAPMRRTSKVPVGSITKACTATVAMILASDGDVELDDPVSTLLGPVPQGDTLTLRRLLRHTSGLPCDPRAEATSCLRELGRITPVCAPDSIFSYSNLGYAVVGELVAAATGMSWRDAVTAILCQPAGIEPVFLDDPLDVAGHATTASSVRAVEQMLPPVLAPAGGLALSAADLVAFGGLHLGKPGLLDVVTATEMHTRAPGVEPFGLADGWALGLSVFDGDQGVEWLGHDGTADGTSCHLRIDQAGGCVLALTTNSASGVDLWRSLVEELRSLGFPLAPPRSRLARGAPVPLPPEYAGTYLNGDIEYVVGPDPDGVPCLTVDGEVFPELLADADGVFSVREPQTGQQADCGRFLIDAHGTVAALQVGGRIGRRH